MQDAAAQGLAWVQPDRTALRSPGEAGSPLWLPCPNPGVTVSKAFSPSAAPGWGWGLYPSPAAAARSPQRVQGAHGLDSESHPSSGLTAENGKLPRQSLQVPQGSSVLGGGV